MKNTITLLLALITFNVSGQNTFTYNKDGLTDYVVVKTDSISKDELFKKSINWIKETYKNPDEVLKTTIDNDKIRFEGAEENLICLKSLGMKTCYTGTYTIEILFKDGRYKFNPISLTYYHPASQYSSGGIVDISLTDGSWMYRRNGKPRSMYKEIPEAVSNLFNSLCNNLNKYLSKKDGSKDDDDW